MGCAAFRALPGEMGGRLAAPPAVPRTLGHYGQKLLYKLTHQNDSISLTMSACGISLPLVLHLL